MKRAKQFAVTLSGAALLAGCGEGFDIHSEPDVVEQSSALTTTATKSLLITSPTVTQEATRTKDPCSAVAGDENRVWTIGHMLKREAEKNGISPSAYVNSLMSAWQQTVTINGDTVPPLMGPEIAANWGRFAGAAGSYPLHKAPFYLLAITSRLDLRKHRPLGEPLGGEVRFVFGLLGAERNNPACPTMIYSPTSTVILEYSPAKADENQVRDFGRRWLALSSQTGSAYLTALQTLTEEVINSGKLLHIRTNDGPETGKVGSQVEPAWHLAEFEPNPTTKLMARVTVKQSPTMVLASNDSPSMGQWIWNQRAALFANAFDFELATAGGSRASLSAPITSYSVPDKLPGTSIWFRGGLNVVRSSGEEYWNAPMPAVAAGKEAEWQEARFRFSVGTCRGCHGTDTETPFNHIRGSGPGQEPFISSFLKGPVDVVDPVTGQVRSMDEMTRRENDLRRLVDGVPVTVPVFGNNYEVVFRNSSKCLDSANNTSNDGDPSQLYACHGNGNQRLSLVSAGTGVYNLKYKHSGKCLDVQNASTANGARVVQMACNSARNSQKLSLDYVQGVFPGPSPRVLRFQHSSLCLMVQNQATANATAIVQGTCPASAEASKGFDLVE